LTVGGAYNITKGLHDPTKQLNYWTYLILLFPLFYCIISFLEFIKTRFNKRAALTISETGVNDNLSIFSCGEIPWRDISNVEIKRVMNADFLVIQLFNNDKYLRGKNIIIRNTLSKWIKKWGSPIIISEKRVDYNLTKLKEIILKEKP
jgi:hypothetical protein